MTGLALAARAPTTPGRTVLAVVGAVLLLAGCTGSEAEGATFVLPSTDVVDCQEHQTAPPSPAYAGDEDSDTVAMLDLLRYWNTNGDKPYCDGRGPTETDQRWAETVSRLQGGETG